MDNTGVLVDTSVIIDFLRKKEKRSTILWEVKKSYSCFMSTVTLFELYCGMKTEQHSKDIEKLRKWIHSISFDDKIAEISSIIYAQLKAENKMIEFRDLFIAATAIAEGFSLATLNREHFKRVKDIDLLQLKPVE